MVCLMMRDDGVVTCYDREAIPGKCVISFVIDFMFMPDAAALNAHARFLRSKSLKLP